MAEIRRRASGRRFFTSESFGSILAALIPLVYFGFFFVIPVIIASSINGSVTVYHAIQGLGLTWIILLTSMELVALLFLLFPLEGN